MSRYLKQKLDLWAIRQAAKTVGCMGIRPDLREETEDILRCEKFLSMENVRPAVLTFSDETHFTFSSPKSVANARNNIVHGRFLKGEGKVRGSMLLVHGWNAELHYQHGLPRVGKVLNAAGFNVAIMELPYHSQRHPRDRALPRNFISDDLPLMLRLVEQSVADLHALMLWAQLRTGNPAGIWGYSLGAWLSGLLCTVSTAPYAAVLATPVSSLELAVEQLEFCEPIRKAMKVAPVDISSLNLNERPLQIPGERVNLLQGDFDCFVPASSVEQLASAWRAKNRTVVPQSHISLLLSARTTHLMVEWLSGVFQRPRN